MPSRDHFLYELKAHLQRAGKRGAKEITVSAAELHRAIGQYPGPNQRLDYCCDVMKAEMREGDSCGGDGAGLWVVYLLPRQ